MFKGLFKRLLMTTIFPSGSLQIEKSIFREVKNSKKLKIITHSILSLRMPVFSVKETSKVLPSFKHLVHSGHQTHLIISCLVFPEITSDQVTTTKDKWTFDCNQLEYMQLPVIDTNYRRLLVRFVNLAQVVSSQCYHS